MATTATTEDPAITLTQGEGDDRRITVTDADGAPIRLDQAVDDSAGYYAVVRFAVKLKPKTTPNADALIFKASYYDDEIEILDQTTNPGECILKIDEPDTADAKPGCYTYEVFITRQDALRTGAQAGTVALAAGSTDVVGAGTGFTNAKPGDVIQITSGPNNGQESRIESITDDNNIVTERVWSVADASATYEIRRGQGRTGALGQFILEQDVVR